MAASSAWIPRGAQAPLAQALQDSPVVCLVGPRQCGKSSLAQRHNSARPYFTFDDSTLLSAAVADPAGFVAGLPPVVTLDEIQRVPGVLPAIKMSVDRDRRSGRFLLTGSSARKLRRGGVNLLGGRARTRYLHPLTCRELGAHFDLGRALECGLLPAIYFSDDARADLDAYTGTYLQQEIVAEGATRNVPASVWINCRSVASGPAPSE